MAVWSIEKKNGNVTLTYRTPGVPPQNCGCGPEVLAEEVLAFACDSAAAGDVIEVDGLVLVRTPTPRPTAGRVLPS